MSLRILIVSDHYPPFIGGGHRQTQLLGKELAAQGYQVSVATVWHGGLPEVEQEPWGVCVYRLKQLRTCIPLLAKGTQQRHQPPFPDPVTVWGLRKLIKKFEPDVIHSYGWISYSCAVALTGSKIPMLVSIRDYALTCPTRSLVYQGQVCSGPEFLKCLNCATQHFGKSKGFVSVLGVFGDKFLLRRKIRGLHSVSSYVQEITRRDLLNYDNEYLSQKPKYRNLPETVIPSFREEEKLTQSRENDPSLQPYIDKLPTEPYILFVGALRRVKGLDQLLQAYQKLKNPPTLVLVGTKAFDSPREFPPGVLVLENFPHKAVMKAWECCLFGVAPSLWPEPLGSVVYEAQSKGKAIIGTRPGGHTDMIKDGESGLLVSIGDIEGLANAMQKLLDDPTLRERLGAAAKQASQRYTADKMVPLFEKFYQEAVSNRS